MSVEHISVGNEKELQQIIISELHTIEKDLTVICTGVRIDDKTILDILCHDQNGQLVVLQLAMNRDDNIAFEGLRCLEYIERVKGLLMATYNNTKINIAEKPRLIIVAPSFSETMLNLVKYINGVKIDLYEWEYLKISDKKGLCVHPVWWEPWQKREEKPRETKPSEKKPTKEKKSPRKEEPEPKMEPPKPAEKVPPTPAPAAPLPEKKEHEEPKPKTLTPSPPPKQKEEDSKKKLKLF